MKGYYIPQHPKIKATEGVGLINLTKHKYSASIFEICYKGNQTNSFVWMNYCLIFKPNIESIEILSTQCLNNQ
jgi:hypothetical protein